MHSRSGAFTLVEVLVVLTIIAVLAAILLAVFTRVRESGRRATCQSNLHQIGLASQQYLQDSDGTFPAIGDDPSPSSGPYYLRISWENRLLPYVKTRDVYYCPSNIHRFSPAPANLRIWDYKYNAFELNQRSAYSNSQWRWRGNNEAQFTFASQTVAFEDNPNEYTLNPFQWVTDQSVEITSSCWRHDSYSTRHLGGTNSVYLDGHVKWFMPEQAAEWNCGSPTRNKQSK